ncbi:MAG: glycosyltransferase, partial [Deltaproteobacteria bacterium]|nr:glycosyltransferase [Deltaproteobacteria bacterium]
VPCYNEARRLPISKFEAFLGDAPDVSFVFVDDGSDDGTCELLRELERGAAGRVAIVELPANLGKAEAVRVGVLRAFERQPAYVGFWDADLATPLPAILEFRSLLDARRNLEMVFGARVVLLGRRIERWPLRHYLGRVAATAISLILGLRVYDTQCGAKLFRATPSVRALFEEPFATRWLFDVEILARFILSLRGDRDAAKDAIYEYPLTEWMDVAGSSLTPADYGRAAVDLLRIWRRYLRGSRL